jgi:crotonobetainyl-CoA:carnitine CoA-transferase CaiB-like acyl-CoA transferase
MTSEALAGIRVVDFTQGMAGCMATMILADYGADVIRIEPPGGDPLWSSPAYLLWNRGKRSVDWDRLIADGPERLHDLIRSADVLIESLRPGEADALGFGYELGASINPALVYVSLSAFGQEGPYKSLRAYDGIVNAKSGRMRDQGGWQENRPTYRAVNDTSYHSAMFAVQALLAALRVTWLTGRGQRVNTSLLRGVTAPNNPWRRFEGEVLEDPPVSPHRETDPETAQPGTICTECKDGRWIIHCHVLVPKLFRSWVNAVGLDWIWEDPRFRDAPAFARQEDRVALNRIIIERMKEKTSAEWLEIYTANPDCCGEIMETTQDALRHPQFVHNGHLIELDDPRVGRMVQVGPIARLSLTPAVIDTAAPIPGQDTEAVLAAPPPPRIEFRLQGEAPTRPLAGVVSVELAMHLAGPFSGALLADLGARVIKVEPLEGDPLRSMAWNENGIRATQGKESLAVDLKSERGREVLYRLVARADMLMHNFRPGVPEKLGADYDTLRAIKPDLVYVYAASYGSTGPNSKRAAFNPTMGALTGNSVFQSGIGNPPIGDQSPDPIAGSGVATGIMLGLAARLRTGKGQYVETTMMNSIVYCNSDDAMDYAGKPERQAPGKEQLGLEATYRLYETGEGWVFLAARPDDEFAAFCSAAGRPDLDQDPRFSRAASRYEFRHELSPIMEELFRARTADEWETVLTAADVGCVRADVSGHRRFLHEDPHSQAIGFMVPTAHRLFESSAPGGKYWRHGPEAEFSVTPCPQGLPYAAIGEHTRAILAELGYSPDEILEMRQAGTVGWPEQDDMVLTASER